MGWFDTLFPNRATLALLLDEIHKMSKTLETLAAEVAANREVTASAVQLLQGLSGRLQEALDADDEDELLELAAELEAQTHTLAAAVAANTLAADPVPDPEPVPAADPAQ